MAEVLAGLLTSAAVGIAKDKLASVIADKANLLWNFNDDLENMEGILESISASLQDAERRSIKEKLVQLWLKRLKNAALDISDTLENYEDTSKQLTAKGPGILSWLPIARKKIDVASRLKSIREELRKINKDFRDFNFSAGGTTTSVEQPDDVRETSSGLPNKQIIGRNKEKQDIINLLSAGTSNQETLIVAVYGLGGMGKSTLAQQIYNDLKFKEYDHRIWVYVSRDFSLRKIGSSIISLLPVEGGQQNRDTLEAIKQCLDTQLRGKKILIVLDDLWEEKKTEIEKLKSMLHVGKKDSMIDVIVTTRSQGIASEVSTTEAYMLQPLNEDICWEIIKRISKLEDKHNQERLKQIGLDIAKKCGGVPLAAQAVGYMLQSKDLSEWIEISKSAIWNMSSKDDEVLPSLKLSYESMTPQLRMCFSYCAIFQKGHNIVENDLIHQWNALGFITKPSTGREYIKQLLGMSFLEVSKLPLTSGETQYTMHDLVHDLATLILADELIASDVALKSNNKHGQKYCRYALVTKYDQAQAPKLSCILPPKVRALHFSDCNKMDLASGAFSFAKYLRILDFSGCSSVQLPASIGKLKQLKFLLAPRMQNEVLPDYITELAKLQYLILNGSSSISALPESISKLAGCLEFLDLSGCSGISELPSSFGDLTSLKHLNMSGCFGINELPDSLDGLTNLLHLELSKCSHLEAIPESLCALTHLQYLNLSSCECIEQLPEAIGCLVGLQHLNMSHCRVRKLPESFKRLGNLLHLELTDSLIEKGLVGALRGLTALQHLSLSDFIYLKKLEIDDLPDAIRYVSNLKHLNLSNTHLRNNDGFLNFIGTLTSLEHLDLSKNGSLVYLPESIGNLKRLHTLNIRLCLGLKSFPESIVGATGLKSLILDDCSPELMDQASSLFHYSLTLPLFKVRDDDVSGRSNLHLLEGESDIGELNIVSLENVRSLEEARNLELSAKQNLVMLRMSWTLDADRNVEDKDLLGELVPPMSLKYFGLQGYSSPWFSSWIMDISHHLPALQKLYFWNCPNLTRLPEGIRQLSSLQSLMLFQCDSISALPEWLSDISSLKELIIWGCMSIMSLPSCIQQLTNLEKLLISGNEELWQWCWSEENKAKLAHIKNIDLI